MSSKIYIPTISHPSIEYWIFYLLCPTTKSYQSHQKKTVIVFRCGVQLKKCSKFVKNNDFPRSSCMIWECMFSNHVFYSLDLFLIIFFWLSYENDKQLKQQHASSSYLIKARARREVSKFASFIHNRWFKSEWNTLLLLSTIKL